VGVGAVAAIAQASHSYSYSLLVGILQRDSTCCDETAKYLCKDYDAAGLELFRICFSGLGLTALFPYSLPTARRLKVKQIRPVAVPSIIMVVVVIVVMVVVTVVAITVATTLFAMS
jgi:hypothetical protein